MERRSFLKLTSLAGLSVVATGLSGASGALADGPYTGPLWVMIHADGGWDPTSFCDPKGAVSEDDPDPMNHYLQSQIAQAGPFRYPDVTDNGVAFNKVFFEKYQDRLVVVNGIDTSTNSHDAGTRVTWSGTLIENKPAFAALVAGVNGPELPMSFITNGGYSETAGVVAQSRVGNVDALESIAYPNVIDSGGEATYHSDATMKRIQAARLARQERLIANQRLPRIARAMGTLYTARLGQNELQQLVQYLPETLEPSGIRRQAQVALAAYKAGLCISANLSIGGFDTHDNNDGGQFSRLASLFDGVDYLMTAAEELGVGDRVVVVMGSDFGRTPGYNSGDGKDHWSITSMMAMGAGIKGGRLIGETDDGHTPLRVDPVSLKGSSSGVKLTPGHVQGALRRLAGIDDDPIVQKFPLKEKEALAIFG